MLSRVMPSALGAGQYTRRRVNAKRARQAGISMIEIAVTLVILALAMAAVMPDVTATIGNARLRSSAESITAGLARARMEAMRRNGVVTFWLMSANSNRQLDNGCATSATSASWVVAVSDPSGACAQAPNDDVAPFIQVKHDGGEASSTLAVAGTAADRSTSATAVRFDGYGRIAGGDLRFIDLDSMSPSNDTRPLRIEMTNSGVVRMCEPRIASTDDPRRCLHS
jgi:type IV fimbrial biogenesis protein FimT